MRKSALLLTAAMLGQSCASPAVVDTRMAGDEQLSCDGLIAAMREADRYEEDARDERGVTGTNVAAALFFWPGMVGTYLNTDEAIDAAKERKAHLNALYDQKGCGS